MVSKDFICQMEGYGLTTATILYRLPDHPSILQEYIWQNYDLAPRFPELNKFLAFWQSKIDGKQGSYRSIDAGRRYVLGEFTPEFKVPVEPTQG